MKFVKNEIVETVDGKSIVIEDFLGDGGQGEVYLASCNGNKYAFKYYKQEQHPDFIFNLVNNIARKSPLKNFLWPLELVMISEAECGYLMDIRDKRYVSFVSYLTGKNKFSSMLCLLHWCIELCCSFKVLHEKGFSYQDLNDGSFFLNPNTGDLLICDNDNVTADKKNLGILGKMRYMAPEIVRRDEDANGNSRMPDIHSDRFSLSVILFLAFCKGNPYEGEVLKKYDILDEQAEYEVFGSKPLFIFHETDKSNRPIRGYHTAVLRRWPILPAYIQAAFHRTFVEGLEDRENGRTTELEWLKLLTKYRDEIATCKCGQENVYFADEPSKQKCVSCGAKLNELCTLEIGRSKIALEPGKSIYSFHIDKYSSEYNKPIGIVIQNKNNPAIWGIRINLANGVEIEDIQGNCKAISQNGVIPIVKNLMVKFDEHVIGDINK